MKPLYPIRTFVSMNEDMYKEVKEASLKENISGAEFIRRAVEYYLSLHTKYKYEED